MEFDFLSSLILLSFIFFMFKILKTWKMSNSNKNLPPGPWKLPLIGNLHQLAGSQPHQALRDLATKYGPLMYLRLGEVPTLIVSSAEYAKEVMKTHDVVFASRPPLTAVKLMTYDFTDIVFAPYGEYWRQLRKICTMELLSMKRVQSLRSIREQEVSNLVEWISSNAGSPINLTEKVFSLSHMILSKAAFKKDYGELLQKFVLLMKEIGQLTSGFDVSAVFPSMTFLRLISRTNTKIMKIHQQVDGILEYIINEQLKHKATSMTSRSEEDQDLVNVLLKFHERGDLDVSLTIDNIKAILLDIFSGGSDTSSMTVDWSMVEMLRKPRIMEKAQAEVRQVFDSRGRVDEAGIVELKYLKLVIKETLRLHPPAPLLIPRENQESCEIKGYEIPSKTKVMVNAWAIGRDPKYWTDPERYYPERFLDSTIDFKGANFEYIPFGAGRRVCPGIMFGIANVELALSQLLYYFDWKLPNGMKPEDLSMTEDFGITIRRRDDLYVIPTPYHPSPSH